MPPPPPVRVIARSVEVVGRVATEQLVVIIPELAQVKGAVVVEGGHLRGKVGSQIKTWIEGILLLGY